MIDPSGVYDATGFPIKIEPSGDCWKMVFAGVPAGFEPTLERLSSDRFIVLRGPFDGSEMVFENETLVRMGPIPAHRVDNEYAKPPGHGLREPEYSDDPETDQAFARVLDATHVGGRIEWDLPYPKHEFVRWAERQQQFLFHSSTNCDIEVFEPIRQSFELADHGERGNLGAVYATHDGYWSMFFGIVDRDRIRGSMRNSVFTWDSPDGREVKTYQFSLERESLKAQPFTNGVIYLLPRSTFRRLPWFPGGPLSGEWASEESVRPVASLAIEPSDFPFLQQIGGHDEDEFLGMLKQFNVVLDRARGWSAVADDTLAIDLEWTEEVEDAFQAWIPLAETYMPAVTATLDPGSHRRRLTLVGPPTYIGLVAERLGESE